MKPACRNLRATFAEMVIAFREWFTPTRRRLAGGALFIASMVGPVLYPSGYWVSLMAPGIIFFSSAWPSEVHDKR